MIRKRSSSEGRQQGRSIARATRGLRRPSLDARSLAQPCYLPEENHRPPEGEKNKETKAVLKQERSWHE
jgi:hypothetical protein